MKFVKMGGSTEACQRTVGVCSRPEILDTLREGLDVFLRASPLSVVCHLLYVYWSLKFWNSCLRRGS